jgi:hypothetical protein
MDPKLKALVKKWEEVLSEGNQITNEKIKASTALMLENQHLHLLSEAPMGAYGGSTMDPNSTGYMTGTSGDAIFHKIAVPMVRRTFPELIAHELVGVQPMTGPVGLAFALRFTAGGTNANYADSTNVEIGYNTIDNTYSGTNTYYSASPSGAGMAVATGEALGSASGTAGTVGSDIGLGVGSGTHIKEVSMTVEKAQVEAKTRKLRSRWSLEVAQDLKAMHGLNIEEEMMDILAYEITAEIDRELVYNIDSVANTDTWDYTSTSGVYQGRWQAERFRELYHYIINRANEIARLTRRGAGNFIIANPAVSAVLETLADFTIMPVTTDINTAQTGVARLGSLGGRMTLYRDTFETSDQLIIGYKGPSEYDTGIIYLPYIQLLLSKATFEDSFNPVIGLMSRYAIHSHLFGAANYYRKMTVSNLP